MTTPDPGPLGPLDDLGPAVDRLLEEIRAESLRQRMRDRFLSLARDGRLTRPLAGRGFGAGVLVPRVSAALPGEVR